MAGTVSREMATKEKKSSVTKQLKDNQSDKEKVSETPKKRGRKSLAQLNLSKLSPDQKSPKNVVRRKRTKDNEDGRSTPKKKRARRSAADQDEAIAGKTPPSLQKVKKTHLEKELGDLLENATGRNTPTLPRNKKLNEKDEDSVDSIEDRAALVLPRGKKELEDDNISVKSMSALSRGKKNAEKEIDDDVLSVRSVSVKSKKTDLNEDDASSVRSLIRSNLVGKPGRKKKSVLKAIAVKKKIFIRRGRPKKIKDLNDTKGNHVEEKRVGRIKVVDKNLGESKQKRVIKKPLKFQNKIKDQARIRPNLAIKNQNLKKAKLKLSVKKQKGEGDGVADQFSKERLKTDSPDGSEGSIKKKGRKRKKEKKEDDSEGSEKASDIYFFSEGEAATQMTPRRGKGGRFIKVNDGRKKAGRKPNPELAKKRSESGIHFETTRSPDDESVMIVHPRMGPKIKPGKRLKPILPKGEGVPSKGAKGLSKDALPATVLPNSLSTAMPGFNQISSSYLVQSIPNFNLFAANSSLVRSFNCNSNFETVPARPGDMPYEESTPSYGSKMSSSEIIVTPSGIVLSGGRLVPSGSPHSTVCFNGSNSNFASETSNGEVSCSPKEAIEGMASQGLIFQSSTTVVQAQTGPSPNTAIFLKRPEAMSTSLISTTTGAFLLNPSVNANGGLKVTNVKPHSVCNPSTDTIVSEKALEGDFQEAGSRFKSISTNNIAKIDLIPSIPVAKNVNDLIMLKNRSNLETAEKLETNKTVYKSSEEAPMEIPRVLRETNFMVIEEGTRNPRRTLERKMRKRTLRNVRHFLGSGSELTFSDPETSCLEMEDAGLFKTISCERINKSAQIVETKPKVLLQLGSEPISMSDTLAAFETASMLLVTKKEKLEEKLEMEDSPKVKGAVDVCRFSKENEEALKEFGLDSDLDQGKSDGDSPVKNGKMMNDFPENMTDISKKAKIKEEVDNILKEMPNRRISNAHRKSESFKITSGRMELKSPLVHKNSDYHLSLSPSKPPTVIDKLLERNKSLKKAEQEGKCQNAMRNLSEGSINYEVVEVKPRRNLRETKTRKYPKAMVPRRSSHKRFGNSGCKMFERRGSNPEIYSSDFLAGKSQVANENVPLRRVTDPTDVKFQRRSSIDYESIQKVLDRRCSLPIPVEDRTDPKLSKSMEDVNKIKTENIKTIIVGSSKPLTTKNREYDVQPRVINIVTSNCGYKKGKNLMEEIGLEMKADRKSFLNGEKCGARRVSLESSNSESENLQKLVDGLTDVHETDKLSSQVPYFGEKGSKRAEKNRLSLERNSLEERKTAVIEETPEDLVTKETILSALGLQSLKAAAQSAQKKKDSQNQQNIYQTENGGYTGTLKTVIKIQRQEKKGSSKSPIKMVYKASSSSSSVSGQMEDSNNFDEAEAMSKEDTEENNCEESKNGNGKAKSLVIPEKASSFSIHPGRMCSDVCTYCFGKFGLLDTPCHIAQLKDADKRRNILATEVHLTADSCLCDACFRHVDKKSNCSAFSDKKNDIRKRSVRKQTCIVQNCNAESQHSIKRKLFLKLKKSIGRKVVLDAGKLEKLQPGQSLTFCNRHIYWIDYFMSCGICKKRLTSVNMYRVTSEVLELNAALSSDEIPAILTENRFLCKICNCFASIRIKCKNPNEMSSGHRQFYETCRKRILKCHGMDVPNSEPEGEGKTTSDQKSVRRSKKSSKPTATVTNENSKSDNEVSMEEVEREAEKEMKEVSHLNIPPKANGNLDFGGVSITPAATEVNPTQIHVKLGNLNIGALGNLNIGQDARHGSARGSDMQCFPTETELALRAHFDLKPSAEDESAKTARKGFEKCTTTIQFSPETKNLFYNLQMPYGNQSSFFRHLILLEKYFRSGDLVISRNADPKAVNYISSVQNRIRSYEGVHSPAKKPQEIPPSLSIVPQPVKVEARAPQELKASALPSRPFTLTPMPSNSFSGFLKNSPLSQIQATVQNIQPVAQTPSQGLMTSLLKSSLQTSKFASHPKPEVSITSVSSNEGTPPVRVGKASVLTSKIQENLRNLASKSQGKQANQARAVILNRTVGGQKQSLVQVTTGGKTIHLTLSQFRRIQQMQMRKKQYLEHQAKMHKGKDEAGRSKAKVTEDGFNLKNLSPELEIQEVKQKPNGNGTEIFPLISEVRSLAGEETVWDKSDSNDTPPSEFPKIPKTLSVSVTKIPPPDYSVKEQSVKPVE